MQITVEGFPAATMKSASWRMSLWRLTTRISFVSPTEVFDAPENDHVKRFLDQVLKY